jgi:hypothetical protein
MILYDYAKLFYTGDGCPHETEKRANGGYFAIKTRRLYRSHVKTISCPIPSAGKRSLLSGGRMPLPCGIA